MKRLLTLISLSFITIANAQRLIVEKTQFLGAPSICNDVLQADNGNMLFTGYFDGNFGGTIPNCSYQDDNIVLGSLDSNLSLKWITVFAGNGVDRGKQLCHTRDGEYVLLAESGSSDGDFPVNTGNSGGRDIWIIKFDNNGSRIWSKDYGGNGDDQGISIAATADSGFIVLGSCNGSGGDIPFTYSSSPFTADWFVLKIDKDGNKQWCKTLGGSGLEWSTGTILTANQSYYLISGSNSKDHDCLDTTWHSSNVNTDYDIFLIKLDTGGNTLWTKSFGGSLAEIANSAELDPFDSTVLIAGTSASNDYQAVGNHSTNLNKDLWVIKTDKDGKLIWSKMLGGKDDEQTNQRIGKLRDGGYLAVTTTLPGKYGTENLWAFNLDKDGNTLFDYQFGGNSTDVMESLVPWKDGWLISGYSMSTSFSQGNVSGRFGTGQEGFFTKLDYFLTSIKPISINERELIAYPNPTNGVVTIQLPQQDSFGELLIFGPDSKTILKCHSEGSHNLSISTVGWVKGTYNAVWKTKTNSYVTKVLCK